MIFILLKIHSLLPHVIVALSLSLMDSGTLSLIELMLFVYKYKGYCILHLHHIIYLLKMCAALTNFHSFSIQIA